MTETGLEMPIAQRVDGRTLSHGGWGQARHVRVTECGHPEKRHYAHGLCRECYHLLPARSVQRKSYYLKNKERYRVYGEQLRERKTKLKKAYGIGPVEWQALSDAQGGLCAICQGLPGKKGLSVDHCHATRRVRGLLCSRCNTGLGQFQDNPALLTAAIEYLASR